jgi:hypothetical protein
MPPKVLSLGGGTKPAASTTPFVRVEAKEAPKSAPVLSLGGGGMISSSKPAPKTASIGISLGNSKPASPAPSSSTPASSTPAAAPASSTPAASTAPSSSAPTPAPEAAEEKKEKKPKAPTGAGNFTRAAAKNDADAIAAEAEKHLAEDTLKDLYGGREIDQNGMSSSGLLGFQRRVGSRSRTRKGA